MAQQASDSLSGNMTTADQLAANANATWGPGEFSPAKLLPRIDPSTGGFVEGSDFYDYMLNHARNTPVEVVAFELQKGTGDTSYYVLPWEQNTTLNGGVYQANAYINTPSKYPKGYNINDLRGHYHTHKRSFLPSRKDLNLSLKYSKTPFFTIAADGISHYSIFGGNITNALLNSSQFY